MGSNKFPKSLTVSWILSASVTTLGPIIFTRQFLLSVASRVDQIQDYSWLATALRPKSQDELKVTLKGPQLLGTLTLKVITPSWLFMTTSTTVVRPPLSGVISHMYHNRDYSRHVTLITPPSYLIVLLKPGYWAYLTTQEPEIIKQIYTYIHTSK